MEVKKEAAATTMPTTASVVEPADIVERFQTLQMKGRQLLSAVTWNEKRRVDPQRCGDTWQ